MLHFLGGMLHRFAKKLFTFETAYTYIDTHVYIYIHIHIRMCILKGRLPLIDTGFAQFAVI